MSCKVTKTGFVFVFILCCSIVRFGFVLVSSVPTYVIGWEEHVLNDLFCVETLMHSNEVICAYSIVMCET